MSTILPETQLYLSAYSNHLTTHPPVCHTTRDTAILICLTATTLQQHPPFYHTTRDKTVLTCLQQYLTITSTCLHTTRDTTIPTCLQQPPYNNIHLSAILPETQIYLPAYRNHLTIISACLPYYQRYNYLPAYNNTHLSTILPEKHLY